VTIGFFFVGSLNHLWLGDTGSIVPSRSYYKDYINPMPVWLRNHDRTIEKQREPICSQLFKYYHSLTKVSKVQFDSTICACGSAQTTVNGDLKALMLSYFEMENK